MSTNRVNRTGPASGWLPVGAQTPTDGGPRKSTNGLETEGGTMPRGEMAGAVEVNGLEHGASRGGASGTTPELDCGMDVGATGTADTDCGTGATKLDPGTLDAERENGLGCGGTAGRGIATGLRLCGCGC